jgi:hypothetical protein
MAHAPIERCPSCGYCAYNVAEFDKRLRPVIESAAYRSQLADARYPWRASNFICAGMLDEADGQPEHAGMDYLFAAQTLDDAGKDELARAWLGKAADTFVALLSKGELFAKQPDATGAILITDCLRRAGRFAEALQVIGLGLSQSDDSTGAHADADNVSDEIRRGREVIQKTLAWHRELIQREDTDRHLMNEAFESNSPTSQPQKGESKDGES